VCTISVCLGHVNEPCEYSMRVYARTVNHGQYGGSGLVYLQSIENYPPIKYIPKYGFFSDKVLDSVVVYYSSTITFGGNLFDTTQYTRNHKKYDKRNMVRGIIKDRCSSQEMWIMFDYSIVIDDISYDMPDVVINLLGKYLPTSLRDNWEIHYNYMKNNFYLAPYQSPIKIIEWIEGMELD
jgi:hypothetical protein